MLFSSLFVDPYTMATDGLCLSAVALNRRHKSDAAMPVLAVVSLHKCPHQQQASCTQYGICLNGNNCIPFDQIMRNVIAIV
jgi:hypothetical protein